MNCLVQDNDIQLFSVYKCKFKIFLKIGNVRSDLHASPKMRHTTHTYVGLCVVRYSEQTVNWTSEDMVGEFQAKDKVGWVHTTKAYGEVEIQINRFLNSVPEEDNWSFIHPGSRIILETLLVSRWKAVFHIIGSEVLGFNARQFQQLCLLSTECTYGFLMIHRKNASYIPLQNKMIKIIIKML